jgi:hypothetical protein
MMANEERAYDICFGVWDWDWDGCDVVSYGVWVCFMGKGNLLYNGSKGIVMLLSKEASAHVHLKIAIMLFIYLPFAELGYSLTCAFTLLEMHLFGSLRQQLTRFPLGHTLFRLHRSQACTCTSLVFKLLRLTRA